MSLQPLEPLDRPVGLAEQVYLNLRAHLRNGAIVPGQALHETPLATRLGVSRTPVREALTRLASEGLLVSGGRSFTVPSLTRADVDDIYELRFLVEPAAIARVAARAGDPGQRDAIESALAAARAAHESADAQAFTQSNAQFHDAWIKLVSNPHLLRVIERYADHMQQIRALTLGDPAIRRIVLGGLESITSALRDGDREGAAAAMRAHLENAKRAFIAAVGLDPGAAKEPL